MNGEQQELLFYKAFQGVVIVETLTCLMALEFSDKLFNTTMPQDIGTDSGALRDKTWKTE